MTIIIIIGVITTLVGLGGLVACILRARAVRREKLEPEETRARLKGLIALNMGSVFVAMFGLIIMVMGLIL